MSESAGDIRSIHELLDAARTAREQFGGINPWFRGHAKLEWQLLPTVHRHFSSLSDKDRRKSELSLALEFQLRAVGLHANPPPVEDWPTWLALMRHYGLPTCLFDWTTSVLAAAFFATWNRAEDNIDGALWCLFPGRLNQLELQLNAPFMANVHAPKLLEEFQDFRRGDSGASDHIVAYLPLQRDIRQVAQQSAFTLHRSSTPLEARHRDPQMIMRFRIPAEYKVQVRAGLLTAGIQRTSFFPDLEHLAQELTEDHRFA